MPPGKRDRRRNSAAGAVRLLSVLAVLLHAALACAKLCGDDVQGQDVPCACGDTLVSSVVLTDDPVTHTVCPGDGLIVRPSGVSGITVDLNGQTIRGSGRGAGLWVLAGGARVMSTAQPAHIEHFRDGVAAQGDDALRLLENVVIASSGRDGVRVHGANYIVNATQVIDALHDGFALGGHDFLITATRAAHSGRYGYFVMATRGTIGTPGAGNTSQGSGEAGFNVTGMSVYMSDCTAINAADNGIEIGATNVALAGCVAADNLKSGIVGDGGSWYLRNNQAVGNGYDGLVVHAVTAIDEGGNSGADNRGERWHRPAIQCSVDGAPCAQ